MSKHWFLPQSPDVMATLVEQAGLTVDAAQARYRQGLSDFLPVLSAIAMHQGAEAALLDARRQLISHRIQLHRALGGTWAEPIIAEAESNHP